MDGESSRPLILNNATLTMFKSEADAEAAVRQLARNGYDLSKVSMVGRDADGDARLGGDGGEGGLMGTVARASPSWGGMKGMLVDSGCFFVPGIGSLLVAGPLLNRMVRSMGPVRGPDNCGAMADGLQLLGIPRDSIVRCEAALKSGKVVVIAEGSAMAMIHAREVFRRTLVEVIEQHVRLPSIQEQ